MDDAEQRRYPVSVLLASREKKEQMDGWLEPEPVIKNEILLPGRNESQTLLTPAGDRKDCGDGAAFLPTRLCELCLSKASRYTCPRCNMPYCGLTCYKSLKHSACSEEFYKECVFKELHCQGAIEKESVMKKMNEILLRLRQRTDIQGGMGSSRKDLMGETGGRLTEQNVQSLRLLSRLAEIQASGKENHEEIKEIMLKLKEIEEGIEDANKDEVKDLAEKLSGHNIDILTEEELWSMLPPQDKMMFEELIKGGGIGGMVPQWSPWWQKHEQEIKILIEELEECEETTEENSIDSDIKKKTENEMESDIHCTDMNISKHAHMSTPPSRAGQGHKRHKNMLKVLGENIDSNVTKCAVPPISDRVPELCTICSNPSPLVQFSLVNILYGYSYCLCLFNGDISESDMHQEFCQGVLIISECLISGKVYCSLSEALEAGVMAIAGEYFDQEDPDAPTRAIKAVAHILTGERRQDPIGYTLAALTQLGTAFRKAKGFIHKEEAQWRHKYFIARKKCEFLQSWVKENSKVVGRLAALTWREYSRRWDERMTLQKEKQLENVWMCKSGREKSLIEEIK